LTRQIKAYLGIDVGSVSTNFALVEREGKLITGIYLATQGQPLQALRRGWQIIQTKYGDQLKIVGIGTTGSGRHLAGRLLQADVIRNEITAQLQGTLPFFPQVDTIFEIGGQDSKYIAVDHGRIKDFTMNKICAAGTGSFLEEQAEPFGLNIKEEFATVASKSTHPYDLGSRCTVFMESELVRASSICFNCLLGTVSGAIAQKIRRDFQNIPIPTLIFKGKEDPSEESRLEAFVYQVRQLREKKQQAAQQI